LRIFDAATICIAFVICAVLRIDLIRRRMSCVLAMRFFEPQIYSDETQIKNRRFDSWSAGNQSVKIRVHPWLNYFFGRVRT
jgi:hypothetical protein